MFKHFRMAFSGWLSVAAALASAFTAFQVIQQLAMLPLSDIFEKAIGFYQEHIRFRIEEVVAFLGLPQPPSVVIDLAVLWFVLGGLTLRTTLSIAKECEKNSEMNEGQSVYPNSRTINGVITRERWATRFNTARLAASWALVILVWPLILFRLLSRPRVMLVDWSNPGDEFFVGMIISWKDTPHDDEVIHPDESDSIESFVWHKLFDIRPILLIQASALLMVVLVLLGLNSFLDGDGLGKQS